jgi:CheY-like chemotaxis protein
VRKVLVIDDDEQFLYYVVMLLARAGHDVFSLQDGSRAQAVLQAERIDAIVTDLYMPNVDGLEILGLMRRYAPGVPVIGISGGGLKADDPCIRAMKVLGATVVLPKPLDVPVFLASLRDVLRLNAPSAVSVKAGGM